MPEAISLKFGMWSTEVGGSVHSKNRLVSSRQHRATEVRKLRFVSSCQYTHGVARRLLGPHDTLPCVLIYNHIIMMFQIFKNAVHIPVVPPIFTFNTLGTRGHSLKFYQLPTRVSSYTNSFFPDTIKLWNNLPNQL